MDVVLHVDRVMIVVSSTRHT